MRDLEYRLVRDPRVYEELLDAVSDHYENVAFLVTERGMYRHVSVRVPEAHIAESDHIRNLVEKGLKERSEDSVHVYDVEVRSVDDIVSMSSVQANEDLN